MGHYNQIIRNQNACSVASGILKIRCDQILIRIYSIVFLCWFNTHRSCDKKTPINQILYKVGLHFLKDYFLNRKLVIVGFRTSYNDTPHFRADPVLLSLSIVDRKNAKLSLFMHQGMWILNEASAKTNRNVLPISVFLDTKKLLI